jgi:GNAT superfamily N-acetyltransferase
MQYRQASVADAPTLAALNAQLIRDEGHRNPMSVAELANRMAGWLASEYEAVLFEEDSQIIGYALYRRDQEYIYLRQFYVVPDCRRQGLGRAALEWLRQHAWGGQRVRVEVLVGNVAAVAFWRAVGFTDYCVTLELEQALGDPAPPANP